MRERKRTDNFLDKNVTEPYQAPGYRARFDKETLSDQAETVEGALSTGLEDGICGEVNFPTQGYGKKDFGITYSTSVQEELDVSIVLLSLEVAKRKIDELGDFELACNDHAALLKKNPQLSQKEFLTALIEAELPVTASVRALSLMCDGKRKKLSGLKVQTQATKGNVWSWETPVGSLQGFLDETLEKGRVAGIAIDPSLMARFSGEAEEAGHAVSLVGRKKVEGRCFYRIRNSWGVGEGWSEPCNRFKGKERAQVICEKEAPGYFLVERELLVPSLMRASRLWE